MSGMESPNHSRRVSLIVAWYDLWIGAFFDRKKRLLYIFPVPCVGVCIRFKPRLLKLTVTPFDKGGDKIRCIKEIRAATGLGLREAKEATEGTGLTLDYEVGRRLADNLRHYSETAVERVW